MLYGFLVNATPFPEGTGLVVQTAIALRVLLAKLAQEEFPEQVVVAVPLLTRIALDFLHEQVFVIGGPQLAVYVLAVEELPAEGGAHLGQDCGIQQEALEFRRQPFENLFGEEIEYLLPIASGPEGFAESILAQPGRAQDYAGDPAFVDFGQFASLLVGHGDPVGLFQEDPYLVGGELEVGRAYARYLLPGGQGRKGQARRDGSAGDDDQAMVGQIAEHVVEEGIDLGAFVHVMVVVQHDGEVLEDLVVDGVHQHRGEGDGVRRALGPSELGQDVLSEFGEAHPYAGQEVFEEDPQVGVQRVYAIPAHGHVGIVCEVHQQGRFAVSGRGRHQQQFSIQAVLDEVYEALPAQEFRAPPGNQDFGLDQGSRTHNRLSSASVSAQNRLNCRALVSSSGSISSSSSSSWGMRLKSSSIIERQRGWCRAAAGCSTG